MSEQPPSPYEGQTTRLPQYTPPVQTPGPARTDDEPIFAPPPRHRAGPAKLLIGIGVVLLLASGLGGALPVGGFVERTVTDSAEFDASEVTITVGSGRIVVERGDDDEIALEMVRHGFGWTGSAAQRSAERLAPTVTQAGRTVSITEQRFGSFGIGRWPYVEYRLRVPEDARVTADAGSGDITVREVEGELALKTGSGNIEIDSVEGRLSADTGSGNIEVDDADVEQGRVSTGTGDIRVARVRGDLEARAGSGNIAIDAADELEADLETGSGNVELSGTLSERDDSRIQTGSGNIRLTLPDSADARIDAQADSGNVSSDWELPGDRNSRSGQIGSGGADVTLRSGSGNIEIERD